MFSRFDMIHERDRQTNRRTDGQTDRHRMTAQTALMHSITRQKLWLEANSSIKCMSKVNVALQTSD